MLAYEIYEAFQRKDDTVVAAIDLEDAYNRVDFVQLVRYLLEFDVNIWIVCWIAASLMVRKVVLKSGRWMSDPVDITPGLPQGSPLSPVLFNIYTSKIASNEDFRPGGILTFADDITVYEEGKDWIEMARSLEERLQEVARWCEDHKAAVNPAKAQVLWCSLNNKAINQPTPPITFDYEVIERLPELRYLGVVFDRSLSFAKHVDHIAAKARKGVNAIKTMEAAQIHQRVLFLMMQLVVLSIIDYGLGCLTLSATQIGKLEKIQNEAIRAVTGCTRDTPIICMRYLLDLSSIKVRHKLAQAKMYLNVMADDGHPLYHALKNEKGNRLKRGRSWMAEAEESLKRVCDLENISCGKEWQEVCDEDRSLTRVIITMGRERREIAPVINDAAIKDLISEHSGPDGVVVYTDGSVKKGEQSGWGFIAYIDDKTVHTASGAIGTDTSSMRMEIEAITNALRWMADTRPQTQHITIVTDSQSTLKKIENHCLRSEWLEAIKKTEMESATWIYCPGHAGVRGNEAADALAGQAVINGGIQFDKHDVLKSLDRLLREEEKNDGVQYHGIVRMKEMGIERGEGRKCQL